MGGGQRASSHGAGHRERVDVTLSGHGHLVTIRKATLTH
ncbi:hypothetical protein PAJL_1878 [Cutibacterium acnes HL042PA3]|nr:hypothetical protein HMPREF9206_0648 [Cutibacterium acnes J139]ESK58406.1 hypothetical protein PAJL_1878 [Cutibacterium acnes HL042PA3]MCW5115078.1 hypothetical protein [Cutibacterium acnes P05]